MKVLKITQIDYRPYTNSKKLYDNTQQETITNPVIQAGYKDFNINFRGRTPENFYAQEFNVKNMPETMKSYLSEDYETRKYLPPEQVMNQSFKYLNVIDNFSDVKSTYPDETLFENLHEANLKGRTGILSDIKIAKEMSDTPLLKDGSDNFGMYLLKKIFLEGKTIKEINKDFYEKDLAAEYKGAVTQPITYGTTSAYGIKYPKTDFWNSFIATRDEYKKFIVDLPKQNKNDLKKELAAKFGTSRNTTQTTSVRNGAEKTEKTPRRKYSIKKYQRDQIKKDIKDAKADVNKVEKSIRKHFTQNDPEASFIVKYLSPIMTIAADRVHLSEEEKDFAEMLQSQGKKVENLFGQFWKAKPELLDYYSTMITDTIDLFEETYEEGGTIPINNEYQVITDKVKNQKPIDFVSPRFLELLDHVQTIVPNRMAKYTKHDELQKEWEEHFDNRYGKVQQEEIPIKEAVQPMELLKLEAERNNAKIYLLHGTKGQDIPIVANLDETFGDYVREINRGMPSGYINALITKALKNPLMTEDAKLSFSTIRMADLIDDERILGKTERDCIMNSVLSEMRHETVAAEMAMGNVFAGLSKHPEKIFRTLHENNFTEDLQELTKLENDYGEKPETIAELNRLYSLFKKPLSDSETLKVANIYINSIRNFDMDSVYAKQSLFCLDDNLLAFIEELKKTYIDKKDGVKSLKKQVITVIRNFGFARMLLKETKKPELQKLCQDELTHVVSSTLAAAYQNFQPLW
mgnify:CR=1 FL=1